MFAMTGSRAMAQKPTEPEARIDIPDTRDPARAPRIAVFRAAGFPTIDAPAIADDVLDKALAGLPADTLASTEDIKNKLLIHQYDLLVLPYGSAFPVGVWTQIKSFLERGGGLVVLGGAPFHAPIRYEAEKVEAGKSTAGRWVEATRQPTFAHELLIGPSEKINITDEVVNAVPASGWTGPSLQKITAAWTLTPRLTTKKDFDKEDGTAGPRDAVLRPVFHLVRPTDRVPVAAPLVEIDRLRGSEAGARWVFVTCDAVLDADTIRQCVVRGLAGASELDARPVSASIEPGEPARIRIIYRKPFVRKGEPPVATGQARAFGPNGSRDWSAVGQFVLGGPAENRIGEVVFDNITKPGLYTVEVECADASGTMQRITTGFWLRDAKLLRSGPKVTVSRDWLLKDGKPFPIVGTTYMASDVHRKFLFEPNPALWDRDFALMRANGINLVRTGFWTGWQRAMLDPGAIDEAVLRALDAYIQCAARNGIVVCFNFFAFQPPMYGGSNPFLDPRALEGQKALLAAVARRYKDCGWVHYDLINEPSYSPQDMLWNNRPIGDDFEKRAWARWVRARHGDDLVVIRDRWREPWGDVLAMPKPEEFNYYPWREWRRPRKVADFNKFSHEVVAGWAADLRDTLRATGGDVLVTLGQDEGGTGQRPAQQLYVKSVDYTSVHTWWNNDDLLWDAVVTKVPGTPNLIQETGMMRLEDMDGFPWRSPAEAARLLERKFALAFAACGAGAVQWAWNINPYMPIDNEAVIGVWRADGTAKPELSVFKQFAGFFEKAAPWMSDYNPDPVVIIYPHSRIFAARQRGADAVREIVRALAENCNIVPTVVSELTLTPENLSAAKLVIIPCAEMLESSTAQILYDASRAGIRMLFTGWIGGDPYGRITPPLAALGVCDEGAAVALHEPNTIKEYTNDGFLTFDDNRGQWLRKSTAKAPADFVKNIWHEPLPVEFAREPSALRTLLMNVCRKVEIAFQESTFPLTFRVLEFQKATLVIAVNETPDDLERTVRLHERPLTVSVKAGRSKLILIERDKGTIVASTE